MGWSNASQTLSEVLHVDCQNAENRRTETIQPLNRVKNLFRFVEGRSWEFTKTDDLKYTEATAIANDDDICRGMISRAYSSRSDRSI